MRPALACGVFRETAAEETQVNDHAPLTSQPPNFASAVYESAPNARRLLRWLPAGRMPLPSADQDENLDERRGGRGCSDRPWPAGPSPNLCVRGLCVRAWSPKKDR